MKKIVLYHYLGTNGTIISPVHLEDTYFIRKLKLVADEGKLLTNGTVFKNFVIIPEDDESLWNEVPNNGQI